MQLYAGIRTRQLDRTSAYAKTLAEHLAAETPDLVVAKMAKNLRQGKVFIDWSQNNPAKTTIAPYSLRGHDLPTVSTPITWEEVRGCRTPEQLVFTADDHHLCQHVTDRREGGDGHDGHGLVDGLVGRARAGGAGARRARQVWLVRSTASPSRDTAEDPAEREPRRRYATGEISGEEYHERAWPACDGTDVRPPVDAGLRPVVHVTPTLIYYLCT